MSFDHFIHHEIFQIGVVLLAMISLQVFSRPAIERLVRRLVQADRFENATEEKKREDTVIGLFHASFSLVVGTIAFFVVLGLLHVNVAGLLTGAGLFGVIFGLGAQSTIKNYLSGIFILTENQYRVGDYVTMSGGMIAPAVATGVVEDISLRITKLRDEDGSLRVIRNGDPGSVVNSTFKQANAIIDVTVHYDTNLETLHTVMDEVGKAMLDDENLAKLITAPIKYVRVDNFTDMGVVVKASGKVRPGSQWQVAGEYRRALQVACVKHKIKLGIGA